MRTGEILDLANERRLSAVLDFTPLGGELLILNGGSRAEELVVLTIVEAPTRTEERAAYCIDSGTSVQLFLPVAPGLSADSMTVRIIGGHGEMLLRPPRRALPNRLGSVRGWATLSAATLLLLLAGGQLSSSVSTASADPEPAGIEAPLIHPRVSLRVPAPLPNVVAKLTVQALQPPGDLRSLGASTTTRATATRVAERHVVAFAVPAPPRQVLPDSPMPRMTDLRVPKTAKSGDFVPVSFGAAVARQVKIVASIGPMIVSKTIVGAQHGSITIQSPKSDLDSRIMTVRAYAQNGNRTSTLQAMVVLVRS
jgi:hypothetical protein